MTNFFEQYRKSCEAANGGKPVVIPANDPKNGRPGDAIDILFVNERPGPTALDTRKVSFDNPDSSAWFFKFLFENTFGLKYRKRVFITNSVIWCDKKLKDKNQTPTNEEVKSGTEILIGQIGAIKPKIIVPLGGKALRAVKYLYAKECPALRSYTLNNNIGEHIKDPHLIYPVYHTSLRARFSRYEAEQLKDWKALKEVLKA
jgi:uracil-DNA glycosylase family 4